MNGLPKIKSGFKKEFYFFEPKRTTLGLDIGDKIIRIAVLKETARETHLLKLASIDILVKENQNDKAKETALASTIEKFIKENNIKAKYVYTNLPLESLQIRFMSVPYVPEEELKQGLQYEAQQHFSSPLESAHLDYMILGDAAGAEGRMYELVAAACPKEIIEKRISLFQRLGLKLMLLGITPLALWNSFEKMEPESRDGVIGLLDLKDSQANLSIFMKGKLRFVRDISLRQPLSGSGTESVEELVTEIGRTLDYYKAQTRIDRIDRLVLSGEGAKLSNIVSVLSERLGVTCEKANPLKNIRLNGKGISGYSEEAWPEFTAAIGLGLMSRHDKTINLLPKKFVREGLSLYRKFTPWLIAGVLAIIIFSMHIGILARKRHLLQKRNEFTRRVNEFRELYNEFSVFKKGQEEIEQRLAFVNARIREQKLWPQLFRDISEAIPDELWLNSLKSNYTKKGELLELKGYGFSNQAAMEFINRLKKRPYFNEVKLNFIRADEVASKKVISFEIICQFKETE